MKKHLLVIIFLSSLFTASAQILQQYFDGNNTDSSTSLIIGIVPDSQNVWQIGKPQKTIFNSAHSNPNVIVTDSINAYPVNNVSRFRFKSYNQWGWSGGPPIIAMQWAQKLDLESGKDGGIVEYSVDDGATWSNAFNNPYVYNFYGYDPVNKDTLPTGEFAFSGSDTTWKDIWLCFDWNYFMAYDTILFQFTLKSDSVHTGQEGWMIDNFWVHTTIFHTAGKELQKEYMKVYPTVTDGLVQIEGQKLLDYHIIEHMELVTMDGKVIRHYGRSPVKFFINVSDVPDGMYFLRITTNIRTVTHPVFVLKQK